MFCTRHGNQLNQRNILRQLHQALEEIGFEQAGAHSFRRYRTTFLRNLTACPESILDFWLAWSSEGMAAHYDKIKSDVAFRKEVANSCGVGFDVPASLGLIEPIEPKLESYAVAAHWRPTLVSPSSRTMSESPSATAAYIERPSNDQDTRRTMKVARSPKSVI